MKPELLLVLTTFLGLMPKLAGGVDSAQIQDSLAFSCLDKPFVSVAVTTPNHDGFPAVELVLRDPMGRVSGFESGDNPIPNSAYGNIVQMPEHPLRSKAQRSRGKMNHGGGVR